MCLSPPQDHHVGLLSGPAIHKQMGYSAWFCAEKIRCHNILQLHSGSPTSGGTYYKRPAVPRGVDYFLLNYDLSARPADHWVKREPASSLLTCDLPIPLSPPPLQYLYRFNFLRFHLKLLLLFLTKLNLMYFSLIWKFSKLFINTNCITTVSLSKMIKIRVCRWA